MQGLLETVSGAMLGGFMGLLVGLSESSTVGIVVTSLAAAASGFLAAGANVPRFGSTPERLIGFGVGGILAVFLGIFVRTHDSLSPRMEDEVKSLTALHIPPLEAARLVVSERYSMQISSESKGRVPAEPASPRWSEIRDSVLAADHATDCAVVDPKTTSSAKQLSDMLEVNAKGRWKILSDALATLEPEQRAIIFTAAWNVACAPR